VEDEVDDEGKDTSNIRIVVEAATVAGVFPLFALLLLLLPVDADIVAVADEVKAVTSLGVAYSMAFFQPYAFSNKQYNQ